MRALRALLVYKSRWGAIVGTVVGSIAFLALADLLLLLIVVHSPRDYSLERIRAMVLYFLLTLAFLGGGITSLVRINRERRVADFEAVNRAAEETTRQAELAEWDLPMGDPRRRDS